MGNSETELEGNIEEAGKRLQDAPQSVDDLLPLLDQLESLLSRVEQSPSQSMLIALRPAIMGLTAKELLENVDTNVHVAVTTCISEITRITAPEAPYDDDLMKEIFQRIVQSFRNLDDMSSSLYPKRVSILETVAKVRSCVVMLDLECDSLILDMFHHFLNTIRDNHPESVFTSMETIMTLVLEESEDISPDLLSCLLMIVKKDNKSILPIARKLAEKVIANCALKLKPCLMEAVQSIGAPLADYSKIVAAVCQESSDVLEHNGVKVRGECSADENKVSERTVSDEIQQGLGKLESEVASRKVNVVADKSPTSLAINGTVQAVDEIPLVELTSPNKKSERSRRGTNSERTQAARSEADNIEAGLNHSAKRVRGRRSSEKEAEAEANKREKSEKRIGRHASSERSADNSASVVTPTGVGSARPKRGRSSGYRGSVKRRGMNVGDDVPVNGNSRNETTPSIDIVTEKQIEDVSDSEKKPLRHLAKKLLENAEDSRGHTKKFRSKMDRDLLTDSEGKQRKRPGRKPKSAGEGETSEKSHSSKSRLLKGGVSSDDNGFSEQNLKGPLSSPRATAKANRDLSLSEESLPKKRRKKRTREEISENLHDAIKYDESLVGVKIKVWWPDDEKFYAGIVDSYNPSTMRHKVLYNDGDEEDLFLKKEVLKFRKGTKVIFLAQKKRRRSESSGRMSKLNASPRSVDKGKPGRRRRVDGSGSTTGGGRRRGRSKSGEGTATGGSTSRERKSRDSGGQVSKRLRSGGASAGTSSGGRRLGRRPKDLAAAEDGSAGGFSRKRKLGVRTPSSADSSAAVHRGDRRPEAARRRSTALQRRPPLEMVAVGGSAGRNERVGLTEGGR
ncbi:unnamed protein product [Spirodela intermedia]|uniref:PTM/DIR17-like Tudor domain-containing protein n=1 Tax=Spirodela intermedia TaxID=51605 RepID=A0A7I8JQ18_SPIIN|nr:unnamed protein product [Spirodela intermedia]CAA6672257.1 unnamed protein product [Spirodela intermedia]